VTEQIFYFLHETVKLLYFKNVHPMCNSCMCY